MSGLESARVTERREARSAATAAVRARAAAEVDALRRQIAAVEIDASREIDAIEARVAAADASARARFEAHARDRLRPLASAWLAHSSLDVAAQLDATLSELTARERTEVGIDRGNPRAYELAAAELGAVGDVRPSTLARRLQEAHGSPTETHAVLSSPGPHCVTRSPGPVLGARAAADALNCWR